jgi:hypothetical protein
MMDAVDQRCVWFSEYLQCDPLLVQQAYELSGAIRLLDRIESKELKSDIEYLNDALSHATKAASKLEKLSNNEQITQTLAEGIILNQLQETIYKLQTAINSRRQLNLDSPGNSGRNDKAHALANMTILIFESAGWNISFGVHPESSDPNTNYCKAVKKALDIFDARTEPGASGQKVADWHSPALSEFRKYKAKVTSS